MDSSAEEIREEFDYYVAHWEELKNNFDSEHFFYGEKFMIKHPEKGVEGRVLREFSENSDDSSFESGSAMRWPLFLLPASPPRWPLSRTLGRGPRKNPTGRSGANVGQTRRGFESRPETMKAAFRIGKRLYSCVPAAGVVLPVCAPQQTPLQRWLQDGVDLRAQAELPVGVLDALVVGAVGRRLANHLHDVNHAFDLRAV